MWVSILKYREIGKVICFCYYKFKFTLGEIVVWIDKEEKRKFDYKMGIKLQLSY